jgi:hypothetical protein
MKKEVYTKLGGFYVSGQSLATAPETVHRSRRELVDPIRRVESAA